MLRVPRKHVVTCTVLLAIVLAAAAPLHAAGDLQLLWTFPLELPGFYVTDPSPAVGDLDGDPTTLEAVFGTNEVGIAMPGGTALWGPGGRYVTLDPAGQWLWDGVTPDDFTQASPAIVDLNDDGFYELLGASCSGRYVLAYDGMTGAELWRFGPFEEFKASPALADVRPDLPGPEIFIANQNRSVPDVGGQVFSLGADGQFLWSFQPVPAQHFTATTAVGDANMFDEDWHDVVAISDEGTVYLLNGLDGTVKWTFQVPEPAGTFSPAGDPAPYQAVVISSPAFFDIDGMDGYGDIIFGTAAGNLYSLNGLDGSVQWTFPTGGPISSSPVIGDVDGDAFLEVVFGSADGRIYCLDSGGQLKWVHEAGAPVHASPSIFDRSAAARRSPFEEWRTFRGNLARTGVLFGGYGELTVLIGTDAGALLMLSGLDGTLVDSFQANGPVNASPAVADIDGDGMLEILFKDGGTTVYALRDNASDTAPPLVWSSRLPGLYQESVTVSLYSQDDFDPAPVIHYTVNGSAPDLTSPVYTGPITITVDTQLQYFAVDGSGNQSPPHDDLYSINHRPWPSAPPITAVEGMEGSSQVVPNDPDTGETPLYNISSWPAHGTAAVGGFTGLVTYTPEADFVGTDSLTVIVDDLRGGIGYVTISVTVAAETVPPSSGASPSGGLFQEQVVVILSASDNLDPAPAIYYTIDGSEPSAQSRRYQSPLTLTASGTLSFLAVDRRGNMETPFRVESYTVNHAPQPTAAPIEVKKNKTGMTTVSPGDPDPGDTHTYAVASPPLHGVSTVSAAGLVTYKPEKGYTGSDALTVDVFDNAEGQGSVTIQIAVGGSSNPPPSREKGMCTDGVDNDLDGLTDCLDPDCRRDRACR